jgi:hypothetical protein
MVARVSLGVEPKQGRDAIVPACFANCGVLRGQETIRGVVTDDLNRCRLGVFAAHVDYSITIRAGLVMIIWGLAGPALSGVFQQAIDRVSGL